MGRTFVYICPGDGKFGVDIDDLGDCRSCACYEACAEEAEKFCDAGGKFGESYDALIVCKGCDIKILCKEELEKSKTAQENRETVLKDLILAWARKERLILSLESIEDLAQAIMKLEKSNAIEGIISKEIGG